MNTNERQLQKERREGDGTPTPLHEEKQAMATTLEEVEAREARRRSVSLDDAERLREEDQSATRSTTSAAK